jgi:predicted glycogen debranching enzyme
MVTAVPVSGHSLNAGDAQARDPGAPTAPTLGWGRAVCGNLAVAETREWLVTNGIGGYAAGTIAGLHTRRYHGLLIAALTPPLGRTLLVTKFDETATLDGREYPVAANRWTGGVVDPTGFQHLERFHLEGTTPVWTFACANALLEKRVWMQQDANTTYVRYHLRRATSPVTLAITALVNYRDHHSDTQAGTWRMRIEPVEHGLRVAAFDGAMPFYLLSDHAEAIPQHTWHRHLFLRLESDRGLAAQEDHLRAGLFRVTLQPGDTVTLVASTDPTPRLDGAATWAEQLAYERQLIAGSGHGTAPDWVHQLILAADQFVVRRALPDDPAGSTVIAGYPWFGDWGRHTMISLPGLTLTTRRSRIARYILRTFARFVDQGMLPNCFPDAGEAPEYNTVDATLWYLEAIRAYHVATGDDDLLRELFPVLQESIAWHLRGTRYHIHVDPADGLLSAGEPGVQLTWMDARVGGRVITPRTGKAVEVNALWYNGLRVMAAIARHLGKSPELYHALADQAEAGFARFWSEERGYLYDVIDGPEGNDATLRPNQLLAVSLAHSPLNGGRRWAVVDVCARHLLTSHGLRSLAPGSPGYAGHYGGDPGRRDGAYHQGTVWAWLIGPFVSAHLRVYRDPALARSYLLPLVQHLADHGVGSIGEIFDGDPPFAPNGCFAQAWSVAELLRAWQATEEEQ